MSKRRRKYLAILAMCAAGSLFQVGVVPAGCSQFYGQTLASSLDFCSVFNCTSGTFFNLCEPVPLFMDCPNLFQTP